MRAPPRRQQGRGLSLSGQLLLLQAVTVLLVVLVVTPVLAISEDAAFRRTQARRAMNTAESLAATPVLRVGLATGAASGVAGEAERIRGVSGAELVVVYDADGEVVHSSVPDVGPLAVPREGGSRTDVLQAPDRLVAATVPVVASFERDGEVVVDLVGHVRVGYAYPRPWERLGSAAPAFLAYVLVGSVVGLAGSLLISRRIKRQTFGLEPLEIRGLVEHREALLHGLREGVVGVDAEGRVTVLNDEARRLLSLPDDAVGRPVADAVVEPGVRDVLVGRRPAADLALTTAGRVLVLNQMPVEHGGRHLGWVTTVRDRTEQVELTREVAAWRDTTDVLRAQAHEFSNRLHTVAGLVELEEYDELARFIDAQARSRGRWVDTVLRGVQDRSLAALLVAKGSQSRERGVDLVLAPETSVPPLSEDLVGDVLTVVGNLVDNAVDAVSPRRGRVEAGITVDAREVTVTVVDDGPGLDPEVAGRVFEPGVSTKDAQGQDDQGHPARQGRGWGLALCRLTCEQRGGDIEVHTSTAGTRFVARLPLAADAPAAAPLPTVHGGDTTDDRG